MTGADPDEQSRFEELQAITIGGPRPLSGPVLLVDYDPAWPVLYERLAGRIRSALGERVGRLEHVGSTSVPGLAAKPRIDICLEVTDASDEGSYVPALEAVGFELRIREVEWYQHRVLVGTDIDSNLHVFPGGCPETARMLAFRDRLRSNAADRAEYEAVKRELATRPWAYMQDYADAKSEVVEAIIARAARSTGVT